MMKLTNVLALEMVLAMEEVKANADLVAKLETMKAQFEKKNKSATKDGKKVLSAEQKKNETLKEQIVQDLQGKEPLQIKEMLLTLPCLVGKDFTNQKISALMKQLAEVGKVEKIVEKRVTKFKLV